MLKWQTCRRSAALAAAVLLSATAAQAASPWWNAHWSHRRPVAVEHAAATALPGLDAAAVALDTAGLARGDAADVRVVAPNGREVPRRILHTGPVGQVRLAFALRGESGEYHVYFGNADACEPATQVFQLQRGLIHEVREFAGGRFDTLDNVRALLREGTLLGRAPADRVFVGHNPFGATNRIVSAFRGHFWADEDGDYAFAIASRNASFLLVDGRVAIANPGRHGVAAYDRHAARVPLSRGLHQLEVLHASDEGDPVVAVAWQPPWRRALEIMPADAFAPLLRATAGVLEARDGRPCADIDALHAGEAWAGDAPVQRMLLRAAISNAPVRGSQWQWDLGDGQNAQGAEVEHVYLAAGIYTVTATCRSGSETFTRRMQLAVARPWAALPHLKPDDPAHCAAIVSKYDFAALPSGAHVPAIELLHEARLPSAALAACDAFWRRLDANACQVEEALPAYLEIVRSSGDDAALVRRLLADARAASTAPAAALYAAAAQVYLDQGDARSALRLLLYAQKIASAAAARRVQIAIGDAHRLLGDAAAAAAAYAEADNATIPAARVALRRGDFARTAEDYIRRGLLEDAADTLRQWQDALPADKLQGFWSLHRMRMLLAAKDFAGAEREGRALLAVNPASPHAAEVLMLTAQACEAAGKTNEALAAWKRLATSYPESVFAEMARTNAGLHTVKR